MEGRRADRNGKEQDEKELPPKRGPGRPRKHPLAALPAATKNAPKPEAQPKRKVGRPRKNPETRQQQPPKKRGRPPKQKAPPVAATVEKPSAQVVANNEVGLPGIIGPRKESQAVVVKAAETIENGGGGAVPPPYFQYIHTSPYEELYTAEHGEDLFEQVALLFDSLHDPKKLNQVREAFARFGVVVSGTSDAILEKASEAKQLLESEKVWKDGWMFNFGSEQSTNNEFPTSLLLVMIQPEKIASASVYQLNEILSLSPCPLKQVFGYFDPGQEFALLHWSTSNAVRTVPTRKAAIFLCRAFLGMKVLGWKSLNDTPDSSQTNGVSRPTSSLLRKIRECLQILDTSARSFGGNSAKQVEESSSSAATTSAPPKRGPGRPRKHPLPLDAVAAKDAPLPPSEAPPKKMRGDPRKNPEDTQPQPPSEAPPKKKRGRPRKDPEAPPKKKRGRPRKNPQPLPLFEGKGLPSVISPRNEVATVNAHIVGAPLEKVSHDGDKHEGSVEEISDDGDANRSSTASKPEETSDDSDANRSSTTASTVAQFLQNLNDLEDVFEKQLKEKTRERDRKQSELLKIQQEISVLNQVIVQLTEKKKVEVDDHMEKITGAGFYRKKS